jgi:2-aminoadipate transaminase
MSSVPLPPFAQRTSRLRASTIRELLKLTESRDILSLAGGLPSPDSFPLIDLRRESDRLLSEFGPSVVQYSATDGVPVLRSWIAEHAGATFGRTVDPETQILVTHGSQQALDLIGKVMVDEGDVVVVEDPGYLGMIQCFDLYGPQFEAVPGDENGMRTDVLAERLANGLRPKLVYVVANFHNPTGATLAFARRQHLAELADAYGFLIVEDDPYGAIRFRGAELAPVASFSDRVVHLSTFSKMVAPGFRVGWCIGPPAIIAMLNKAKQATDLHTSTFAQYLLANLVSQPGWLDDHRRSIVPIYRERADALADALAAEFGERALFHRPDGGMFLWATFPELTNTDAFAVNSIEAGVAFIPGQAFAVDQQPRSTARFSFATLSPEQLRVAAARLGQAYANTTKGTP